MTKYSLMTGEKMDTDDTRHPTEYPTLIQGKSKVMAKKSASNEEQKKELRDKIKSLSVELNQYRKVLNDLEIDEVESWYQKNKWSAFKFKWSESDPEFSGVFRIEGIHEDTCGASWLWLHGTMVSTYEKGSVDGVQFWYKLRDNQLLEENKITKTQFNSFLKRAIKKIKLS